MSAADSGQDEFVERHLRRNAIALGADYGLFVTGLTFASQSTILPAFAVSLGAPNVVIGAIPAVMLMGWFLPALFAAGHTESLPTRLGFVMRWTIWERVPFPALALAALLLAEGWPRLTLAVLLLMLLATTGVGGMLMPAWMDLVARAIPTRVRGRFFAGASIFGNLGGLGASAATAWILGRVAAPRSYALCFAGATVCMALSFWALACTREGPPRRPAPAVPLREYLARIPRILREDANFARYLGARLVVLVGSMASGFYTVYALRELDAQLWHAGVFSAAMLAGQIVGNIGLGWLADHHGHRLSLMVGSAATALAGLTGLVAPGLAAFTWVFVLQGINQASISVSSNNILLDFAPVPESRPTYVGIGNTAGAPAAFLAPLAGGLLVDLVGIRPVFALSAAASAAGLALFVWRVREPRHLRALA